MTVLELLHKYRAIEHEEAETDAIAMDVVGMALHSYGEKILTIIIEELEEATDAHV